MRMKAIMLGTGHALVAKYYNACFILDAGNDGCLLVDAGGGSGLLTQFNRAGVDWRRIRAMVLSHAHIDHLLGAVWMLRLVCHHLNEGEALGEFVVLGNEDAISKLGEVARLLLRPQETRFIMGGGSSDDAGMGAQLAAADDFAEADSDLAPGCVRLVAVTDREVRRAIGRRIGFFDVRSTGAPQFGFVLDMDRADEASRADGAVRETRRLAFCGDEPFREPNRDVVAGADWLFHEAFCLESDKDRYDPHSINHGTVGEACRAAASLGVKNLVLFHTEDDTYPDRKQLYLSEGSKNFDGRLCVPDDLETIEL